MQNITISKVNIQQIDDLQKISQQTFIETFAGSNSEENIKDYVNNSLSIQQLSTELSQNNSTFYFATHNNTIIGYLKLNYADAQTELKNENAIEVERIYVLKEYHGKKSCTVAFRESINYSQRKKCSLYLAWRVGAQP